MAERRGRKYFVTRHRGAIHWAARGGLRSEKVKFADFDVAKVEPGDVVMGTLPLSLAAKVCDRGGEYWHLTLEVPDTHRNKELTADEMEQFGARLEAFALQSLGPRVSPTPYVEPPPVDAPSLHVCIVTGQIMANLLPLIHLSWDRVALIFTGDMEGKAEQLGRLVIAQARRRGKLEEAPWIAKKLTAAAPLSTVRADMQRIAAEIRAEFPHHQVVVNWTGGLKPMALAALEAFRPFARLFYCDTERDTLEAVWPPSAESSALPANLLDVETYLGSQEYRITRQVDLTEGSPAVEAMRHRQVITAKLALQSESFSVRDGPRWRPIAPELHLAAKLALPERGSRNKPGRPFQPRQTIQGVGKLPGAVTALLGHMKNRGVLSDWKRDEVSLRLTFASEEAASYIAGGYLEEYAALSALSLGLEPRHVGINLGLDLLNPSPGRLSPELNELDALIVWRNRILLIECKAGRQVFDGAKSQDIANKLSAIRDMIKGFGSAWLASKAEIVETNNPDLVDRLKIYQIRAVSGSVELARLPRYLRQWAQIPDDQGEALDWDALARAPIPFR